MISGKMKFNPPNMLAAVLLLQLSFYPLFCSANTELTALLLPFKDISFIHFSYIETRTSVFFKKPQISSGEIQYKKPDLLIKERLKPEYKKFVVNKNILVLSHSQNQQTQVNINDYQQLQQFVNLIKALLSGNSQYLRQHYNLSIAKAERINTDSDHLWLLKLSPKLLPDKLEQRNVQSIHIKGINGQIKTIKFNGFAGESSELHVQKILKMRM